MRRLIRRVPDVAGCLSGECDLAVELAGQGLWWGWYYEGPGRGLLAEFWGGLWVMASNPWCVADALCSHWKTAASGWANYTARGQVPHRTERGGKPRR